MKNLRIGIVLVGLMLLVFQLPIFGLEQYDDKTIETKAPQEDTVRMTLRNSVRYAHDIPFTLVFYGEKGATYKVIWGDGETSFVKGKGPETVVFCEHSYAIEEAIYNLLLFGVKSEDE